METDTSTETSTETTDTDTGTEQAQTYTAEQYNQAITERDAAINERDTAVSNAATQKVAADSALADSKAEFDTYQQVTTKLSTFDTEAVEAFKWQYSLVPDSDSKPDIGTWVDGLKADPASAHAALRSWLQPAQSTTTVTTPKATQTVVKVPASTDTPTTKAPDADAIKRVRDRAVQTGDWSEWKQLKKTLR